MQRTLNSNNDKALLSQQYAAQMWLPHANNDKLLFRFLMSLGQINKFNFWSTSEITEEDKRSFVSFASMLANGSFQERITLDNLNTNINEVSTFVSEIYKKNYEI